MSHGLQAVVARGPERCRRIVIIYHVRTIFVYHIHRAVEEAAAILYRGKCRPILPRPLTVDAVNVFATLAQRVVLGIQFLRVVAFPPSSFSILLGQSSVVWDTAFLALLVAPLRRFHPRPSMGGMDAHAETQSVGTCRLFPSGKDVFPGTHIHTVPRLVLAVPKVEIVVVVAHGEEILGTRLFVKCQQAVRIPLVAFP